jgi:hypothetical protein
MRSIEVLTTFVLNASFVYNQEQEAFVKAIAKSISLYDKNKMVAQDLDSLLT